MIPAWGARLLTISDAEADFTRRRFRCTDPAVRLHLEEVGRAFLRGYRAALGEQAPEALAARLDAADADTRGFAYEGAGMALAMLDLLLPWRRRLRALLLGPGRTYRYLLHVGAGWARARLYRRAAPWIENDPLLAWLAVDGYGFHQGYFHPETFVTSGRRPRHLRGYTARAFDQGLGRSLWFVCGADPKRAVRAIALLSAERRSDLWSGLGLAAAYAGGAPRQVLFALRADAGPWLPDLAQGAAFAAAARVESHNPTADARSACEVFCGCDLAVAAATVAMVRDRLAPQAGDGPPQYETWRRNVRAAFAAQVRSGSAA